MCSTLNNKKRKKIYEVKKTYMGLFVAASYITYPDSHLFFPITQKDIIGKAPNVVPHI